MSILDTINAVETQAVPEVDPFEGALSMSELRSMFTSWDDATSTAREEAFRDRSYYDGSGQVGEVWKERLRKFNLPKLYINKIRGIVEGHLGVFKAQQVDPEAMPRGEKDIEAAAVATKILRYISDKTKWKQIKADVIEDKYIYGIGAALFQCTNTDASVIRIPFREFCYDPQSRFADFSDANWMGFGKWFHPDVVKRLWPDTYDSLNISPGNDLASGTAKGFNEAPDLWIDKKNKRVQVITMYYLENGVWQYVVWCHAGILDFSESPYLDADGKSVCPLVAMSCYINGDPDGNNERYGIIRDMVHPQDEYNAHRAQALQHVVSRRIQRVPGVEAPVIPAKELKEIGADPQGILPEGYQFVPDNGMTEQISLLQLSDGEMQRMGPTPAVLGRSLGASESGRSRQVQAAAGLTEMATLIDRVERFEDSAFRMIWSQVRQYWTEQQYIRVTGADNSYKFVQLNAPILDENEPTILVYVMDEATGQPQVDEMGQPMTEEAPNIVGYDNHVAEMDMEIIITTVPENVNLEHETWQQILQFSGSTGIAPGDPRFLMLLEVAPLTNRKEIIEKMESLQAKLEEKQAAGQQAAQEAQQAQMQLEMQSQQASSAKDAAGADKASAEARKIDIENQIATDQNDIAKFLMSNLGNIDLG